MFTRTSYVGAVPVENNHFTGAQEGVCEIQSTARVAADAEGLDPRRGLAAGPVVASTSIWMAAVAPR